MQPITEKDIIEAMKKIKEIPDRSHYTFLTEWVTPYVSEEECIRYWADNVSVVVVDSKGCAWHKGKKISFGMRMELI